MPALGDKNVRGLDVAVHDPFRVRGIERIRNFNRECDQRFIVQRTSHDHVLERHAIQKFHGNEAQALVLANFVNGADIGMVQGGGGSGFAPEALERLGVTRHIIGQEFQRNKTAQGCIFGLVDDTHPTAAELFDDAVMRNDLPNHVIAPC